MARLKEMAVGRGGDTFLFNPEDIHELPEYNVRDMSSPETIAHIRSMADAIKAGGTAAFPPITISQIDGKIYVYAGYCRRRAFILAKQEGAPIKGILAVANTQSDEDRAVDLLTSNNGLPLTPMEKAKAVKRLLLFSWTPAEIAKRLGVSISSVGNLIALLNAPAEIKEMVNSGEVSATTAISEIRKDKKAASGVLAGAVEKAKSEGKGRATAKHVGGENISKAKWVALYHSVNLMMSRLGADGEINARQSEVENVMDALYQIDGGSYNSGMK
jgi:ParB/RepB/Spo0J family partition protein